MTTPSKLIVPLFFALIILLLIPLNTNFSNFFTIETFSNYLASFHEKSNHHSNNKQESNVVQSFKLFPKISNWRYVFIGFKNIKETSSINPLLFPGLPSTPQHRAISLNANKCFPVDLPHDAMTKDNCCPPMASPFKYKDFKFKDFASSNSQFRVRKPFT